jgi:uncharacterized protein DUF3800
MTPQPYLRVKISLTHPTGECHDDISADAEALWWVMHHSDDPDRRTAVVTCYLDDSGSDEQSPVVVIGGLALDRDSFLRFDGRWRRMLHLHRIKSLHMTDFVRPHGQYVGMPKELKLSLFREVVEIIRSRKDYSLSASVDNIHYQEVFSIDFYRRVLGPYAVTFISAASVNAKIAGDNGYPDQIAYLVDRGSPFSGQIDLGHRLICLRERGLGLKTYTGTLTFADDENVSALQAADVIAWSSRRNITDGLTDEFEPLKALFEKRFSEDGQLVRPHFHHAVEKESMERLLATISEKNSHGKIMQEIAGLARKAGYIK